MAESSGTWLDTKENKLVTSQPEEGIQLIAPGVEATPADQARVDAVKASLEDDNAESNTTTATTTDVTSSPTRRTTGDATTAPVEAKRTR